MATHSSIKAVCPFASLLIADRGLGRAFKLPQRVRNRHATDVHRDDSLDLRLHIRGQC